MTVLTKGSFKLNLGIVQLGGDLAESDRQCAWESYVELSTRVALTGKQDDGSAGSFDGEILIESLQSVYSFFSEARSIMRAFPVGKIERNGGHHLGIVINDLLRDVLRPFLEKWQAVYRHWWDHQSDKNKPPFERQDDFPQLNQLKGDWVNVRLLLRELQKELVSAYDLVPLTQEHGGE